MPSLGLRLPILLAQREVWRTASPMNKLTPTGFLAFLLAQNRPRILSDTIDDRSGYIKDVKIRFKKRMGLGKTVTTDDCSIQGEPTYYESTIPSTLFRKYALFFEWKLLEKFKEDALKMTNVPGSTPPTTVMQEVIDSFQMALNGILGDINGDLLALQAANFGKNIASGASTARTVNFPLSTTTRNLNEGLTMLLADAMANEVKPDMTNSAIVGSGLINNFLLLQGYDPKNVPALPKFFYDPYAATAWGANQFGLFDRDSVQFINICRFRGAAKSGRFGTSNFGTLKWPVTDSLGNTQVSDLEFDFQAREIDCPTDDMVIGGADPAARGRGLVFDLMCSYTMTNIPSASYESTDRLYLNNGTYRYVATNA